MASLLFAAGVLSYDAIKKQSHKRRARKAHQSTSFADLERDNAARIANLQSTSCFCQRSDWRGGGCEQHGYVPAAGEPGGPPLYSREEEEAPAYEEGEERAGERARRRQTMPPEYADGNAPLAPVGAMRTQSAVDLSEGGRAPEAMGGEEVRRINEERRKRMKAGGFTNFVLRWKKEKPGKAVEGDGIVR